MRTLFKTLSDRSLALATGGNTSSLPPLPYGIGTSPLAVPQVPPGPSPTGFVEDVQGGVA